MATSSDQPAKQKTARKISRDFNFWHWLIYEGDREAGDSEAGWKRLVDGWLALHLAVGLVMSFALMGADLSKAASAGVLPLAAILFALAFGWVGNALSMLTSSSFKLAARQRRGGVKEYAYTYQLAVLTALITISCWGIVALGAVDRFSKPLEVAFGFILFSLASLTVRECWQVIYAAHRSLIAADEIDQALEELRKEKSSND